VDAFSVSSFGLFVMHLFQPLFRRAAWQSFLLLASGWALARERHTITSYLWLSGATDHKHFSRFYVFLGTVLYRVRLQLWTRVIQCAAAWVPDHEPVEILIDDFTKKKTGDHIEGLDRYRNGAGSARQEYRTLRGLNFVVGVMRVPLCAWPGCRLSVPIGLELYLKAPVAKRLKVPYHSRSQLARQLIDVVVDALPGRAIRVIADGGYATKDVVRDLPESVHLIVRLPIHAALYEPLKPTPTPRLGRPPRKGERLGSPTTLARQRPGWHDHPHEAGAQMQSWMALWHSVLPGRPIRVVVVKRKAAAKTKRKRSRVLKAPVEAFFTTDLTLSVENILAHYSDRWAVEIDIRDGQAYYGLGQDHCRKRCRIIGANTFRFVMAAARTLWFIERTAHMETLDLRRYRPWYREKVTPSQLDVLILCREALHAEGVSPILRFDHPLDETCPLSENTQAHAA
jgi:DDE superfamily endonuclease